MAGNQDPELVKSHVDYKLLVYNINPYIYLVDVLQRVSEHPSKDVIKLTPRVWKTLFADNPLRSDLTDVV